jgi:hypothetical protein
LQEIEHEVKIHMCDEMDEAVEVAVELAKDIVAKENEKR